VKRGVENKKPPPAFRAGGGFGEVQRPLRRVANGDEHDDKKDVLLELGHGFGWLKRGQCSASAARAASPGVKF
jgi:hypothetical protein